MKRSVKNLVQGALIGALYAVLTVVVAPISSGLIQFRVSEALTVLPFFTFSAVPGLFVGCIVGNLLVGANIYDIVLGSLATLAASIVTYYIGKHRLHYVLAPLPPVIFNAAVVGALLTYVYEVGVPYEVSAMYVGAGELVVCYLLGLPLIKLLKRWPSILDGKGKSETN